MLLLVSAPLIWAIEAGERGGPVTIAAMTLWSSLAIWLACAVRAIVQASPVPLLLGDASYSIYLADMFAIGMLAALAAHFGASGAVRVAVVPLTVVIGVAAGLLTHRLVELPLLRLFRGRHLQTRSYGPVLAR
jgi:peptidoglycan/LPS O-acetylase OafA/YrhL